MRRVFGRIFLCSLLATSGIFAQTVQGSSSANRLMEITMPSEQLLNVSLGPYLDQARNKYPKADSKKWGIVTEEIKAFVLSKFKEPGGYFDQVSQSYQRRFSETELAEIVAFHQSPTGKKWLRERDNVLLETLPFLQKESTRLAPLLNAQLESLSRKHDF